MGAGPRRSSGRFEKGGRCHNARGLHTEHSKACKRLRCAAPPVHLPKPQQILYTSSGRETKQLEERPAPTRFGGASPSGSMLGPFMVHHSWAEEARWSTTAGRFSVKQSSPFLATGNFVRRDSRTYSSTLKSVSRGPSPCHDFYILEIITPRRMTIRSRRIWNRLHLRQAMLASNAARRYEFSS